MTNLAATVALGAAATPIQTSFTKSRLGKDTKAIANGDATLNDVKSREMAKFKNTLKYSAKKGGLAVAAGATGAALGARIAGVDIVSKLPKFAQQGIKTVMSNEGVQKFVKAFSKASVEVFENISTVAKKHPAAFVATSIIVSGLQLASYKFFHDHGKEQGKIEQKFDDTVKINQQLKKENPLNA